jgi:hypothetical protein
MGFELRLMVEETCSIDVRAFCSIRSKRSNVLSARWWLSRDDQLFLTVQRAVDHHGPMNPAA